MNEILIYALIGTIGALLTYVILKELDFDERVDRFLRSVRRVKI